MAPLLNSFVYKHKKEGNEIELTVKKKDYGELILFDIFFENTFLFTVSKDGKTLASNWESAQAEPVGLDKKTFKRISSFIVKH